MAKQARVTFEGEGAERVMLVAYPAIAKVLSVPVAELSQYNADADDYTNEALDHGWKQRFGDFRALDKDMTDRQKDQEAFERGSTYKEHLLNGGDWKMTPERGLTADLVEALRKIAPQFTEEQIRQAAKHDPAQVKGWRADLRVKDEMAKIAARKAAEAVKEAGATAAKLTINLG